MEGKKGKIICLNVGCADTTIIQTNSNTFLIDCHNISDHTKYLPVNKKIKAIFITHQHYDHFDGLQYLIENKYSVDYLIYSPYNRKHGDSSVEYDEWQSFNSYKDKLLNNGAKCYAPFRQKSFDGAWWLIDGLKFWILGPESSIAESETRELHDACLVIHLKAANRKCIFTGDASDTSLNWIAKKTKNICEDILHASHHGSINGADLDFIKKCNALYTVISTKSSVYDNIPHPTAIKRYHDNTKDARVYRTDLDGTLIFNFTIY